MEYITTRIEAYKHNKHYLNDQAENEIILSIFDVYDNINDLLFNNKNVLMLLYDQNTRNVIDLTIKFIELGLNLGYMDQNNENILFYILRNINNIDINIDALLLFLKNNSCDPYIKNFINISPMDLIIENMENISCIYYAQITTTISAYHSNNNRIEIINNMDDANDIENINDSDDIGNTESIDNIDDAEK